MLGTCALFPLLFGLFKVTRHKLLFIFASYGSALLISLLYYPLAAPFALFLIKVAPSLAEQGHLDNILWFCHLLYFLDDYAVVTLSVLLNVLLPLRIYQRYDVFNWSTNEAIG